MNYKFLIPKPKTIIEKDGVFSKALNMLAFQEFSSKRLTKALADISMQETTCSESASLVVIKTNEISDKQAYSLKISKNRIQIEASDVSGAFYGIKTLKQLFKNCKILKQIEINDSPDLKMRAIHMTLGSGNMPTFKRLKKIISTYADYKLNTFIIEYDDRFPWEKHPTLVHKDALTKKQIKKLIELANDNFIEVIPLLDSLGHAQQYLIHKEYFHLRELPNKTAEMCANNPETLKFMKELWEEVLELHTDTHFAHITGDEVFRMGNFCPECQKYADSGKLAELYVSYYKDLSHWMISKGKIPIIWGDMLIKYPEQVDDFPREVWINDWAYSGIDADSWDFCMTKTNPEGKVSRERNELFNPYWHQDGDKKFTPYPFFKFFKDKGFNTLAATAVSRGDDVAYPVASCFCRFANNKRFAEVAVKNGGQGLTGTFWSGSSIFEGAWFGTLSVADFSWHSRPEKYEQFARRFSVNFLDKPEDFAKNIIDYDKRLYGKNHGFLSGKEIKEDIECTELIPERPIATCSVSGKYLDILFAVDQLNKFDDKAEALSRRAGLLFAGSGKDFTVNLKDDANSNIDNCMPPDAPSFSMESGIKNIWGGEFEINTDSFIAITDLAAKEQSIKIDAHCDNLLFVTTCNAACNGAKIAIMKIGYTDGNVWETPFIAGKNTADWWGGKTTSEALRAWESETDAGDEINAYFSIWKNPDADKKIAKISFESASQNARMIVFAISARQNSVTSHDYEKILCIRKEIESLYKSLDEIQVCFREVYGEIMSLGDMEKAINKIIEQRVINLKNINLICKNICKDKEKNYSRISHKNDFYNVNKKESMLCN
jgi:Glycosyl hydrolase family 20, catalytic domain/Glycosyl hydrolase family 20, domain 2